MKNLFLLNRLGFNPDLTTRQSRVDTLSLVSRQSDLLTYLGRITAILVLVLTIGVGNAWGANMTPSTVTLMDNGATLTEESAGAGVTLPSRAGCTGYTFVGWTKTWVAAQTEWTTTAPDIIPVGSYTPEADENLYPVYTKTEDGGGSTTKSYGWETEDHEDWTIGDQPSRAQSNAKTGSYAGYINTKHTYVTFNEKVKVTAFSFWLKRTSKNSNYNVYIETSTDGSTWSAAATYKMSEFGNGSYTQKEKTWDGNTAYYVRFHCYNTTAARYVDDISITYAGGSTTSYISVPNCCDQLAAPANPGETPNSTGAVLTWDAVTGATGYEVNIDGGGWISTGNGTTTGYTITDKACGGTSVSWQVRATGDGSTNCAKGAATTARNFTTTACACTNQYTYFWGTQITNDNPPSSAYASHHFECFNTWNGSEGKTGLITLPNSDTENYWFVGYNGYYYNSNLPGKGRSWCTAIADMNFANSQSDGKVLGWDGGYSYPRGATGYIRIYSDNTYSNKYAAFIPSGYILRWKNNRNSDAWTSYPFTDTGASNYWETDLVQLGADLSSDKVWVGLPTSGMSESFTWCGKSEEKNLIGVGKKTGAGSWAANGIVAGDANQWGKWRIVVTDNATNWNIHFVPYWKATYDVNGGGAISPTTANEGPVSCEGNATQRQVTMPAAPTYAHHDFGGWKSSADNSINAAGATVSLTQNTTFTAQWTNSQYNITATLTNVTSETSFPVAYTYTGSAANVTYAFEASSGYRLPDNVTVTGSTYNWNKNTGELTLTGTITGPVSITISGTQTHTVTWLSNGSNYVTPVVYDNGAELALPAGTPSAPGGCSDKVFVGWTAHDEITTETSTRPTIISAGGAVNEDATYRAVFADQVGDPEHFKRVTQLSDITEGGEIVFGFYVSPNTKLCGLDFTGWTTYSCATGVDETSNKIPVPSDANIWTVSKESEYWVFTNKEDGTTKLATSSSSSNKELDPETQTYYKWNIGASSSGTNNFYVQLYNGSSLTTCALELYSSVWKIYSPTGNTDYSSNSYTALKLYVPAGSEDNYITLCSTCTTPSDLEISSITSTGGTVSWNGVSLSPTEGFKVAWNTSNSVPSPLNASNSADVAAGTNSYAITGLTAATQYYVFVQSKCDDSWSSSTNFYTNAKITYAAGEGSGSMDPKEVTYNTDATVDVCMFTAPSGKKFNGWVSDQSVTVSASSTTSVPDGATITGLTKAITLTAQWRDLASYTVNFSADNGTVAGGTAQTVYEEGKFTFPNVTSTTCGTFIGWVEAAYDNTAAPSGVTFHEAGSQIDVLAELDGKIYYAVYRVATGMATNINDELTADKIGTTSYSDWSNLVAASAAIYAGNSTKSTTNSNSIQLRSSDNSGIITTTSGGLAKKVTFKWVNGNTSGRVVDIYGKNSAYSSAADLYSADAATQGTKIGSITYNSTTELTISTDYEYIGIRANKGAVYIGSITIQWYGAPMKYQTSPTCSPMVGVESSFSTFTYAYNAGPSASQSFTVSGSSLGADLVVTAPANYEVCKTADGTYTSTIRYTPSDGAVANTTAYIRLAAGLNVGTYNYAAASGLQVTSTGAKTRTAALNGSVTKADCAITFTDFNAVDHYEATLEYGSSVTVSYNYTYNGDGNFSISHSPATGKIDKANKTLTVSVAGIWTLNASATAGTNYSKPSDASAQIRVKCVDTYKDFIHNKTIKVYGSGTAVTDGKMEDWGSGYTVPYIEDNAEETSGSCQQTHYKFMGWVSEDDINIADGTFKTGWTLIQAGTESKPATTKTYYAVWAKLEE